jgi:hypothetical protein
MASILRVNTLTDASSNNSIATSFISSGSAKAWVDLNGGVADDSFNVASDTDDGTGQYSFTYTSNMSSANFSASGSAGFNSNVMHCTTSKATTGISVTHRDYSNTLTDLTDSMSTIHGDLA